MATTTTPLWQVPRLRRDRRVVAGVAAAVADEIGIDVVVVRVAFVVLAVAGGWGVLLYLVGWLALAIHAARTRREPSAPRPKGRSESFRVLGFGLVVLGLLLFARAVAVGFVDGIVWPLALLGLGVGVAAQRRVDPAAAAGADDSTDQRGIELSLRLGAGIACVLVGIVLAVTLNFDLEAAVNASLIVALVGGGVALVVAPWGLAVVADLVQERRRRIRSEERAAMAAHLHDSVLQTLTLIQRRATDPELVSLARRQERELRGWLFGAPTDLGDGFRASLERQMNEVEDLHAVPVELVVVGGDARVDERVEALLGAVREAATNAARHSGSRRLDVFAEIGPDSVDVFVRDQGAGFDPDDLPADRLGVRESITGRMERVGGRATVASIRGAGTEVELHLPREPA